MRAVAAAALPLPRRRPRHEPGRGSFPKLSSLHPVTSSFVNTRGTMRATERLMRIAPARQAAPSTGRLIRQGRRRGSSPGATPRLPPRPSGACPVAGGRRPRARHASLATPLVADSASRISPLSTSARLSLLKPRPVATRRGRASSTPRPSFKSPPLFLVPCPSQSRRLAPRFIRLAPSLLRRAAPLARVRVSVLRKRPVRFLQTKPPKLSSALRFK